ncbi:MAG: DUF421 domain-containing protein [Clostridia bacterium]|nr:DUF421 domain-containing protein [Clostridia bacterium]
MFVRTVITYLLVVLALRITGKRQIGQLQPSELVLMLMISNIATMPLEEAGVPLLSSMVPIATLVLLEISISAVMLKLPAVRKLVSGSSVQVIRNGKIIEKNLKKLRLTVDELYEELRLAGNFRIDEIVCCTVETNGRLSVLKRFESDPVTPSALGLEPQSAPMTYLIISDGKILNDNLKMCGFDTAWLDKRLREQKVRSKDVLMMSADTDGGCYVLKKEKRI